MPDNYILGIAAYYHDSAAALIKNGEIIAAAQEERFTRVKHDPAFPSNAVQFVLEEAGITLNDVEQIVFYDKPLLKFGRLLETLHAEAPRGIQSFVSAIPVWVKEKLFLRKMIKTALAPFLSSPTATMPGILFPEHHLSHAASAFFPSPFQEAAILTVDGVGEWATTTICHGQGNGITLLKELTFPHSLGLLYSAFTAYCGFKVNSGEYKLMGLAPYGNANAEQTKEFKQKILQELVDVRPDGSFVLNKKYFAFTTELKMYHAPLWEKLFGLAPRTPEEDTIDQAYMNMAYAIQEVTEEIVFALAKTATELTGCKNLCLAGGVALNCVANGKLLRSNCFDNIWVQPASGDAGGSLGAALATHYIYNNAPRIADGANDSMQGSYLGPVFGDESIGKTAKKFKAPFTYFSTYEELFPVVSDLLAQGMVVGMFQGRMEFGPRALGNRSILGDPRNPEMQKKLNLKIKYREGFRPFAPAVMEEHCQEYFAISGNSPYMLIVSDVAESIRQPLPENYQDMGMWERLYCPRSTLPAITHVDSSARIQTVSKHTNPEFWGLLHSFQERHNCPVLVNTSFNVRGEPVVCTPEDAFTCFMRTEMDYLVMGKYLFSKQEQTPLAEDTDWQAQFTKD